MIRTHIIPQSNNVQLTVPDNYIGKRVEVIVFSEVEEMLNGNSTKQTPGNTSQFKGKLNLSEEQYEDFQKHLKDIRNEWDREF
ncbi:MAG: hypothetical protein M3004_04365 [Bacteroidota bacterium]|nr:hypothetical protein [Bacteroidota bacterium]